MLGIWGCEDGRNTVRAETVAHRWETMVFRLGGSAACKGCQAEDPRRQKGGKIEAV